MKAPRLLSGGQWRGLARSRPVTLRGVRNLLTKIFNQAAPEQGTAIDYSDLTDEKLMWRRNLLTETEFRNGLTDAPTRGGAGIAIAAMSNYANAIQFTKDSGGSYAYKTFLGAIGTKVVFSVFVQMNDNLAPTFTPGANAADPGNDFILVVKGDATTASTYTVTADPTRPGVYRVSTPVITLTNSGTSNYGIVKYGGNSTRGFRATGYQLEIGGLTSYQALTDVSTEFMAAFPNHSLFQDNLGQLAVFAPEQPIGLALDTRLGAVRGPEAWGASPSVPAGWTNNGGGSYTHAGGSSGSSIGSSFPVSAGKTYEVSFVIAGRTAGTLTPYAGATGNGPVASANGMFRVIFTAVGGTGAYLFANAAFDGTVGNISFREIVGNHATQATVGDRPILSGRINRLINTEDMTTAAWLKQFGGAATAPVVTANYAAAPPDGVATSVSRIQLSLAGATTGSDFTQVAQDGGGTVTGQFYNSSVYLRTTDGSSKTIRIVTAGGSSVVCNLTGTWQRFSGASAAVNVSGIGIRIGLVGNAGYSDTVDILATAAQFTAGSETLRYQRVNTTNDYDAIGFPKGARFNGTNSWMSLSLDLSGSDKLGLVASIRKDSDATVGMVFELSPSLGANNGTVYLTAPGSAGGDNYKLATKGTTEVNVSRTGFAAPNTAVLSGTMDIAGNLSALRVNGVGGSSSTASLGTGAMASATGYIGRRGGTSLPFNGMVYRIGVRNTLADNFIAMMERWANEPLKPTYINSLPQAAAVAPLDRVIILGASLETGAFGGAVNTQSTEIVAAQNRILALTGKAVTIHQYAVSGQDLNGTVTTSWPKALSEQAALPGNGRTLVIIGSGGNTITNASRPLSASVLANAKSQLLTMIDQIEAKGWDWCLFDLSWRNYSAPLNQYDRTQGAWPWITGVTRSINAARKKLWGRAWVYPDGASWGDLYALYRNNVQILADEVHPSDYLLTRNYVIDNVMIPAITGVAVDQRFIRDEAYTLGLTTGTPVVSGTTITLPSMATHQGTLHLALYAAGSNPSAAEVVAGNGTGYLTKVAAGRNGTTIDKVVQQGVTAPANSTNYVLAAVFVSDARQTSGVVLNNVTSGVATGGGGGSGPTSPVVMLLRQDKIASPRANINQLSVTEDLTTPGLKLANAVRLDGTPSGIGYTQVNGFNQVNAAGQSANLVPGYFQAGELNQSWYVDLGTANVNLTGFTAGQSYQIMFAASRDVPSTDATRTGDVTITSGTVAGAATQTLNAANPASGLTAGNVTFTVTAPANGVIGFQFKRTAGNSGFGYIGGIHITPVA